MDAGGSVRSGLSDRISAEGARARFSNFGLQKKVASSSAGSDLILWVHRRCVHAGAMILEPPAVGEMVFTPKLSLLLLLPPETLTV